MTQTAAPAIGRYEILKPIGNGSQGTVSLARDPVLDRLVAIKVLSDSAAELNLRAEDGTPIEARVAGRLKHPNIVPIFDAGETAGLAYLVFDYVAGEPLSKHLRREGPLPFESAVGMFRAILDAVAAAHDGQVLHLDINPRNIMLDAGNKPLIMDFGLAQYVNFTRVSGEMVSGTLRYMAPELFLRGSPGPWTDVFALGSTFFEVVTGQKVFDGRTTREIQMKIVAPERDLSALQKLPQGPAFARFLAGALEAAPEGRYANAGVMREAFDVFAAEAGFIESSAAATHSTVEFLLRRMERKSDFPTISRTLADINRLTSEESVASADTLANVILRDFALTNKLLKLVNSAYFGGRAAQVTSISQAVVFLGLEQVRMTANSLTFFGHLRGDSKALKDTMTRSFQSGMLARHLAQKLRLRAAEEAFICGMCQNLGESLTIFYFPEDADDIRLLQREKQLDKTAASRGVLGVSFAELGAAIAQTWNLPHDIVAAIRGGNPGFATAPLTDAERMRDVAVFANALCDCLCLDDVNAVDEAIDRLLERFSASIRIDRAYCDRMIAAASEKLRTYAPVFEINVAASEFCQSMQAWLEFRNVGPAGQTASVSR